MSGIPGVVHRLLPDLVESEVSKLCCAQAQRGKISELLSSSHTMNNPIQQNPYLAILISATLKNFLNILETGIFFLIKLISLGLLHF